MQVNSATSKIAMMMAQATNPAAARTETPASVASALVAKSSQSGSAPSTAPASIGRTDFTSMTRQEMFDWMNSKIKSGEMSIHDSTPFLAMTLKIPVGSGQGAPEVLDSQERVNFMQQVQDGIKGALSRNDQEQAKRLQMALSTMSRFQGETTRVDIRA